MLDLCVESAVAEGNAAGRSRGPIESVCGRVCGLSLQQNVCVVRQRGVDRFRVYLAAAHADLLCARLTI